MTNREWLNSLSDEKLVKELKMSLCEKCIYKKENCEKKSYVCNKGIELWLKQEHKEPVKLSDAERVILVNIDKKYKWIVRDEFDDRICVYREKPIKNGDVWDVCDEEWTYLDCYKHLFQFIQWEDEEPYNIEELLKES